MKKLILLIIFVITGYSLTNTVLAQGCDLDVNAGPDLFTCDPTEVLQLKGSIQYNYTPMLIEWSPTTGLSDPNIPDPTVTLPPGKYKYKLKSESVSDNLIINGDFEAGNAGFTSGMTYDPIPTGNMIPGSYTVTDAPMTYESTWRCSTNGNVLMGEANGVGGLKVWSQNVPTKPGQLYFFRFIVTKMNKFGGTFYLKTEANGQNLGETQYTPVCGWLEFRICFVATANTTTMTISESRGSRSTFAIDDISMIQKCKDEDEVEIEIVDLQAKLRAFPAPTCNSQVYTVDATQSIMPKSPNIKFTWTATNGGTILQNFGSVIKAKGRGTYKVHIVYTSNLGKCEDETELEVETQDQLEGQMEVRGKPTCNKDTFDLTGFVTQGTGSYSYTWSPATNIISGQGTPFARATNPGKYNLKIVDKNTGCEFETSVKVDGDGSLPASGILGDSLIDCTNPFVNLNSTNTDTAKYFLKWITPDQKQIDDQLTVNIDKPGDIKLVVIDKVSKCSDTAYWHVIENVDYPKIELGNDLVIDCKVEEHNVLPTQNFQVGKFKYIWTLPGGNNVTEDGLYDKKISQSGKVIIRVINEDNNCSTLDSINVVDLRSNPSLKINTPGPVNCSFLNIKITSNVTAKNARINWFTINGNILNGSGTNSITVDKGGRYYVEVEDTVGHCIYLDSVGVTEDKAAPVVDLKTDTLFTCKDAQKDVDGTGSKNTGNSIYVWTGTGKIDAGQGTDKITVSSAGTYTLTMIDTTNGCRDSKVVTIYPDKNIPVSSIANPGILNCKVTTLQLSGNASTTSGNKLKYNWSSAQGNPINNGNSLNPQITKPGTYILDVEDEVNGCKTSSTTVVGIDTAAPPVDLGADLTWKCSTIDLDLDIKNNTQGQNLSFDWSTSNGSIIGNSTQKNIKAGAPGVYRLTVTNQNNFCSSFKDITIIEDKAIPLAISSTGDILTCIKKDALLDSKGSSIGNNYVTVWKDINGSVIGSGTTTTVGKIGKYILQITDQSNNCVKTDTVEVFENLKTPDIDAGNGQLLTCKLTQFDLSGTVIGTPTQFKIDWTTTNGSILGGANTVNPRINKEGDYIMTVTDLINGCISTDRVSVAKDQNIPVKINFNVDQPKCVEDPGELSILNVTGGKPNYTYYLNGNIIDISKPIIVNVGTHNIKVIDDNGCEVSDQLTVIKAQPIEVTHKPEVRLYTGDSYELRPVYSIPLTDIVNYDWSPSADLDCNNCPYPKIKSASNDEIYSVTITDKNGCTATVTIRVKVEERGIWVPNVFSPNGDDINDSFYPVVKTDSYKHIRYMNIYDRWGELVWTNQNFEPNQPANGWRGGFRGEKVNPGVYVWVLEVEWKNGETEKLFGDVTLVK